MQVRRVENTPRKFTTSATTNVKNTNQVIGKGMLPDARKLNRPVEEHGAG